ncbi:hypothetical protein [Janthinobacterium sp. SUN120]|uniref:hypothetical protein n=1 Tax=Janthinobacterium sp. SUN120 TaxID=3004099 RepID=UPI0025AEE26D|nr:hypothetical protein [Janthinobacterium sp. SUN120]MDN2713705.1 hypothetical protein [Janthinobacterium sp. SUN120]
MSLVTKTSLTKRAAYPYTWIASPGDNPNITGKADSGRVSRKEGYEVVDFINAYAAKHSLVKPASGDKIEDMLHACDKVMRVDATTWIQANWATWKAS